MSPLVWDLGHIAAFEDLWLVHRYGGRPMLRPGPGRRIRRDGDAPSRPRRPAVSRDPTRRASTWTRCGRGARAIAEQRGSATGSCTSWWSATSSSTTRRCSRRSSSRGCATTSRPDRTELRRLAGPCADRARAGRGPRRRVRRRRAGRGLRVRQRAPAPPHRRPRLPDRRRRRSPTRRTCTSSRAAATSAANGGRTRAGRGRSSTTSHDLAAGRRTTAPSGAWDGSSRSIPHRPVVHVSWFEADAFARAHDARLPTEIEWEKAATWDQDRGVARRIRGGATRRSPGVHANVDQLGCGTGARRAPTRPAPRPYGCLGMIGDVWEWTSAEFDGYPGFAAVPVPRVLAAVLRRRLPGAARRLVGDARPGRDARRSATGTTPQRRQIFSGTPDREGRMKQVLDTEDVSIHSCVSETDERCLADDVLDGLTRPFKELPPKHFYDARGSELFERICELPEYYPTRTERQILERRAAEIVELTGAGELVELGSGAADKARILLDAMAAAGTLRRYVPLDVSEQALRQAAEQLVSEYDGPSGRRRDRRLRAPPGERARRATAGRGSSPCSAARSATSRRAAGAGCCGRSARLLGPERPSAARAPTWSRTRTLIEAAYDDSAGVTAEFNRNVLHVINRELDADFAPDAVRPRRVLRPQARVDRDAAAGAIAAQTVRGRGDRAERRVRGRRGAPHRDQREVHPRAARGRLRTPPVSRSSTGSPTRTACSRCRSPRGGRRWRAGPAPPGAYRVPRHADRRQRRAGRRRRLGARRGDRPPACTLAAPRS